MKKNGPKRKILLRWTVSYVMILLIPFASFLFSYSKTMQSFKEELSDSNDFLLYTLSSNMDQVFLSIKNAVSFVLTNYTFQKTAQSSFQSPAMASDTVSKLRSALENYVSSSEVDLGILIYYSGQSYIISNHAATDEKSFHRAQIYSGMTLSEKEWNDLLSQRYQSLDFFLSPFLRSESGEDCIVQAVTIRGYQENINLFVTVPVSAFTPHMNRLEQHTVCMQDQEGNVVTLFGDSSAVRQLDFSLPSGSSITGSDGKLYICNYAQSAVSGWHYAVVVSAENYWSRLRSAQSLNFLGVLLALFLGTCLVFLFLRQNYRPVHKIVGLLKPSAPYGNEFELIENSCRNLSDENSFMRDALNRQTAQLRERFLLSRLKGRGSPLIGSDYNAHFKIAEKGETLLLIVFSVGMSESARDGYRDELEYENMNLFAVDNIFSEMMDTYPYYRLEDGNLLMYLLHLDESAWHSWASWASPCWRSSVTFLPLSWPSPLPQR